MNFDPKYTFESTALPGVKVTLKRMGPKRRAQIELSCSAPRARVRDMERQKWKLDADLQAALDAIPGYRDAVKGLPVDEETGDPILTGAVLAMISPEALEIAGRRGELEETASLTRRAEIMPAFLLAAVESIEGIDATAESICEYGPDALFTEIWREMDSNAYLSPEMARNLPSPTTSGAQVDGGPTNTTAPTANQG